jgi:ElaB/YqjD/DUF883 family membrane-anchored ribosome-binding protein
MGDPKGHDVGSYAADEPRTAPPPYPDGTSTGRIKSDIDRTRADMDETIDALSNKLAPQRLLNRTFDYFRGNNGAASDIPTPSVDNLSAGGLATVAGSILAAVLTRKITTSTWRYLQQHPVSTGLFAAGIACMLFEPDKRQAERKRLARAVDHRLSKRGGSSVDARTGLPYGRDAAVAGSMSACEPAGATGEVSDAIRDKAKDVRSTLSAAASKVADKACDAAEAMDPRALGASVLDRIRHNPLPVALIGAGAGWLVFGGYARKAYYRARIAYQSNDKGTYGGSYVDARTGKAYDTDDYGSAWQQQQQQQQGQPQHDRPGDAARRAGEQAGERGQPFVEGAREKAHEAADALRERASSIGSAARERLHDAGHYLEDARHHAEDYVHGARAYVEQTGQRLVEACDAGCEQVKQTANRHPLAIAGGAFGLGLLLGLLIPESRYEDEYLGEYADDTRRRARRSGRKLFGQGRRLAARTFEAVTDEAKKQGLTPRGVLKTAGDQALGLGGEGESIKDKLGHVADRARKTVQEEAGGHAEDKNEEKK